MWGKEYRFLAVCLLLNIANQNVLSWIHQENETREYIFVHKCFSVVHYIHKVASAALVRLRTFWSTMSVSIRCNSPPAVRKFPVILKLVLWCRSKLLSLLSRLQRWQMMDQMLMCFLAGSRAVVLTKLFSLLCIVFGHLAFGILLYCRWVTSLIGKGSWRNNYGNYECFFFFFLI